MRRFHQIRRWDETAAPLQMTTLTPKVSIPTQTTLIWVRSRLLSNPQAHSPLSEPHSPSNRWEVVLVCLLGPALAGLPLVDRHLSPRMTAIFLPNTPVALRVALDMGMKSLVLLLAMEQIDTTPVRLLTTVNTMRQHQERGIRIPRNAPGVTEASISLQVTPRAACRLLSIVLRYLEEAGVQMHTATGVI